MTRPTWTPVGLSGGGGTESHALSPHDPNLMLLQCDMSGSYRTEDGGRTWSLLPWHQLTGCPFCTPLFHPKNPRLIYAAHSYAATLRISRDGGRTFTPFGQGLPGNLRLLACDPDFPARLYAGTTTALYHSTDGGRTWTRCRGFKGQPLGLHVDRATPRAARSVLTATSAGCFLSGDGGKTWKKGYAPGGLMAFTGASKGNNTLLYLWRIRNGGGALLRSADLGATWEAASPLPDGTKDGVGFHALLATDRAPRTLYAVRPLYDTEGTVMKSTDAGRSWKPVTFGDKTDPRFNFSMNYVTRYFLPRSLRGWAITGAAVNPSNPGQVLFSHYCSVFLTRNGGRTWKSVETHPARNPGEAKTESWPCNGLVNTTTWQVAQDPFDPAVRIIAYTDLGMARTEDGGRSWQWRRDTGPNTYQVTFDPDIPGRAWAAFSQVHDIPNNNIVTGDHNSKGQGAVGYTEDHGSSWTCRVNGLPGAEPDGLYDWSIPGKSGFPVTSVTLDPNSPKDARTLYASSWENGVFKSTDGGLNWSPASAGLGAPGINMRVVRIAVHSDGSVFVVITGKKGPDGKLMRTGVGLYRSGNGGQSWKAITGSLDVRWLTDYAVDPRDSRVIYLAACDAYAGNRKEGGLYKTDDGGKTWRRLARKSSLHFGATIDPADPDRVFMTLCYNDGTCSPLWVSGNAGRTWKPVADYPFCSAHRVDFDSADPARLFVSTYGAGVWTGRLKDG